MSIDRLKLFAEAAKKAGLDKIAKLQGKKASWIPLIVLGLVILGIALTILATLLGVTR